MKNIATIQIEKIYFYKEKDFRSKKLKLKSRKAITKKKKVGESEGMLPRMQYRK